MNRMDGAIPISQEVKNTVRSRIISAFGDLAFFGSLCIHKIDKIIEDLMFFDDIDKKTTKVLIERYFEEDKFKSFGESGENVLAQIKIIVTSVYVLFAFHDLRNQHYIWRNDYELTRMYPQFRDVDPEELKLLLNFRNLVRIALLIVPPQKNKKFLLDIGGRLEGRPVYSEYITGSGQKDSVKKRLIIYYSEANLNSPEADVLYKLSFSRTTRPATAAAARDRPNANKKKIEDLNLTPETIELLGSYPADPVIESVVPLCNLSTRLDPLLNAEPRVIQVIDVMKRAFSDMWHFDLLMRLPLRCMIDQQLHLIDIGACNQMELVCVKEEDILRAAYQHDIFQRSKELKKVWEKMRFVMTACKLYLLFNTPAAQQHRLPMMQLWDRYPEFANHDISGLEAEYLLRFRNFMRLGCLVVPGHPKIFLLRVVERLEGADNQYITGKGQTDATDRRVLIFERESGTESSAVNGASSMIPLTAANLTAKQSFPAESNVLPMLKRQRTDNNYPSSNFNNSNYNSNNCSSFMDPMMVQQHLPRESSMSQWMSVRQESFRNWRQSQDHASISPDIFERKFSNTFVTPDDNEGAQQMCTSTLSMVPPSDVFIVNPVADHHFTESIIPFTDDSFLAAAPTAEVDETVAQEYTDTYINEDEPSIIKEVTEELRAEAQDPHAVNATNDGTTDHETGNGFDLNSVFSSASMVPLAVMSRQMSREVNGSIFRRHQLQYQQQLTGMSRQSSQGNPQEDLDALPPLNVPLQRESSTMSMSGFIFTEGSWLDHASHQWENNDQTTASVVAAVNAVGGSAPPPLRIEKEFSVLPLNLHFQPLFSLPQVRGGGGSGAALLPQTTANATAGTVAANAIDTNNNVDADVLAAGAEMMDSLEVFNAPFTETIFGYFAFTETLQQQLGDTIDRNTNDNQITEA